MIYLRGKKSRTEQRNVGESIVYVEGYHMTLKSMTWYNPYVGGSISYVGGTDIYSITWEVTAFTS